MVGLDCQYCGKRLRSSGGRTRHLQCCKAYAAIPKITRRPRPPPSPPSRKRDRTSSLSSDEERNDCIQGVGGHNKRIKADASVHDVNNHAEKIPASSIHADYTQEAIGKIESPAEDTDSDSMNEASGPRASRSCSSSSTDQENSEESTDSDESDDSDESTGSEESNYSEDSVGREARSAACPTDVGGVQEDIEFRPSSARRIIF